MIPGLSVAENVGNDDLEENMGPHQFSLYHCFGFRNIVDL